MSQLEVDKIIPQSGTTLTIGETGDTISFASGVLPALESLTITGDLTVDTTTLKVDSTNNRVGIGTASPSQTLDVQGNAFIGGVVLVETTNNTPLQIESTDAFCAMTLADTGGSVKIETSGGVIKFETGGDASTPGTNATEAMRIDSSGNVGIGTSSPAAKLNIQATAATSGEDLIKLINGADAAELVIDTGANTVNFNLGASDVLKVIGGSGASGSTVPSPGTFVVENNNDASIAVLTPDAYTSYIRLGHTSDPSACKWSFDPSTNAMEIGTTTVSGYVAFLSGNASEAMRIDSSGNVGIGTTSPSEKLTVSGNIDVSGEIQIGSQVTLKESADRADLLAITSSTSTWGGIQIQNSSFETLTSFMGQGSQFGIFDDQQNEWAILCTENGSVDLYHNGSAKFATTSTGASVTGELVATNAHFTAGNDVWINSEGVKVRVESGSLTGAGVNGCQLGTGNIQVAQFASSSVSGGTVIANRSTTDNNARDIINFYRNGASPGYIRATNTLVTYQTFCGAHASQFSDYRRDETIKEGTVMESIDELCSWYMAEFTKPVAEYTDKEGVFHPATTRTERKFISHEGHTLGQSITYTDEDGVDYPATVVLEAEEEHLPKCKISDTVESKGVYGVFHANEHDDTEMNGGDMSIAALGAYKVRINANETVQIGDYLQSNGDGTAKVQSDDIFRASTIAKVTSTQVLDSYDDGSYTVPCTLHCG